MASYVVPVWKKAPFLRLLLPLVTGIILQWYIPADANPWYLILTLCIIPVIGFSFIPFFARYRLSWINGIAVFFLFLALGALLCRQRDIRHDSSWLGNVYKDNDPLVVTLDEPLVEKARSFKAKASASYLIRDQQHVIIKGKILLYIKKDPLLPHLDYGSKLVFNAPLQLIKDPGNPAGFNYKQYCLFKDITHQVYLKPGEFDVLAGKETNRLTLFLYACREKVLHILRSNIKDEKALGLAEALLIGYKDDLDKALLQSYTNTGVVHIVAISGLHLGLIYWLLVQLLHPLQRSKKLKWLRALLIISGLWLFSLLAGAQPSVLRSALMFTCIVVGNSLDRQSSVFNTLSLSAFILLCINPFWLWDIGFQLSYTAILSILLFMRPVYNLFYIKNKLLDSIWKLNAVTIAAQVLTIPLSVYHFHQFPNYFLLTNMIAVPLSSLIVLGEIVLCSVAWMPLAAMVTGRSLTLMIRLMNSWIERIESLPFSLWNGLLVNIPQSILLYIAIAGVSYWVMGKAKKGLLAGLLSLLIFFILRSHSLIKTRTRQRIIVYNIAQRRAVDFINGNHFLFMGDAELLTDEFSENFYFKPARTLFRAGPVVSLDGLLPSGPYMRFVNKNILWLDKAMNFPPRKIKPVIDLLIISKNPKLYMRELASAFTIRQLVFDGSVPAWKIKYWEKDCDSLHIPTHDVTGKGAFVMNLR